MAAQNVERRKAVNEVIFFASIGAIKPLWRIATLWGIKVWNVLVMSEFCL